jgi:hypothetical protein
MLAIGLAGEFVTYGGVSLFVVFFVLAPMGHAQGCQYTATPDGRGHRTRKEDACVGQSTLLLFRSNMGAPTAFFSC